MRNPIQSTAASLFAVHRSAGQQVNCKCFCSCREPLASTRLPQGSTGQRQVLVSYAVANKVLLQLLSIRLGHIGSPVDSHVVSGPGKTLAYSGGRLFFSYPIP